MDDARIDRRAAQTDDHQSRDGADIVRQRQKHDDDAGQHQRLAKTNHGRIVQFHGQETAGETSDGDADAKQASPHGRRGLVDALAKRHIAAGPQHGGRFERAIAEEHHEDLAGATDGEHTANTKRLAPVSRFPFRLLGLRGLHGRGFTRPLRFDGLTRLPQRQAQHQHRGKHDLQNGDGPVAPRPAMAGTQCACHDVRAKQCAQAPHGVQPAHVTAFVVDCHIVVERRIDAARAQAVRNGEEQQHPVIRRDGEAEQCERRQRNGHCRDLACTEPQGHAVG